MRFFPDVEAALNLSINRNPNELVYVEKLNGGFRILFTRYGHGVGLSQRGAEWMAATYGWDYQKILRFYYPGTELREVDTSYSLPEPIGRDYLTTPGPAPTPTPRPTLMPVDPQRAHGKLIARVTEIPINSSLNLRAEASLNSEIIMRLFFGQELVVVEQYEDGWLLVETNVIKGYVREEFVSFD
ncbi:MAG: SH3 domain-containing protein [Eubacteriales bacterium]|nr:SH3 domain-containing protein [Eubacteriales bacterium]